MVGKECGVRCEQTCCNWTYKDGCERTGAQGCESECYCAVSLTSRLLLEFAEKEGLAKMILSRGPIDTPMVAQWKETDVETNLPHIAMGREGKPSEVAELIAWLLCDGSSYMTGTVQSIDGGWVC